MVILLLVLLCQTVHAQQLPMFSQYVLNGFIVNPAMAGWDGYTSFNTTTRQQWLGFKDAPQTLSASYQTRLLRRSYRIVRNPVRSRNMFIPSTKGRVGVGAYVINDINGNVARTGVQATYAYHITMYDHQLSFGLAAKAFQYRIAEENLTFGKDVDPLVNAGIKEVGYTPDLDFGIYFTNTVYFIGASVNNLMQSVIDIGGGAGEYQIKRHYWLMGGYKFMTRSGFDFEPNVLFKTTEALIPQGDIGLKIYYEEDYWAGLGFRTDGSLIALLGFRLEGLFIGYAFDYTFSSLQGYNYGTHELALSYKIGSNARRYRWLRRY